MRALSGTHDTDSIVETFDYPRLGPGMMWEAFRDRIEAKGGEVWMNSVATQIHREGNMVTAIEVESVQNGETVTTRLEADHFISSMPISTMVLNMMPPAPPAIQSAAKKLRYRAFVVVALIIEGADPFPDN